MTEQMFLSDLKKKIIKYNIPVNIRDLLNLGEGNLTKVMINTGEEELVDVNIEYALCYLSPLYFISRYGWIKHPKKGIIPFNFYYWQIDFLNHIINNQYVSNLKSRQIGATTLVAPYSVWEANFHEGAMVEFISTKQDKATKVKEKAMLTYERLPWFLKVPAKNSTTQELILENHSAIISEPTSKKAGRSDSLSLLVMDECAFMDEAEDIITAAQPTVSQVGGKMIVISTPNGVTGTGQPFYTIIDNAKNGLSKFKYLFYHWWEVPGRDNPWLGKLIEKDYRNNNPVLEFGIKKGMEEVESRENEWVEEQRGILITERAFRQEVLGEFVVEGDTVFGENEITKVMSKTERPIKVDKLNDDHIKNLWIWKEPEPEGKYIATCLPPGELVMTDKGYKRIEETRINDKVIGENGYERITYKTRRKFTGDLTFIKPFFLGEGNFFTPEHPIKIARGSWNYRVKNKGLEIQWIEASRVRSEDYLVFPLAYERINETELKYIAIEKYMDLLKNDIDDIDDSIFCHDRMNDLAFIMGCLTNPETVWGTTAKDNLNPDSKAKNLLRVYKNSFSKEKKITTKQFNKILHEQGKELRSENRIQYFTVLNINALEEIIEAVDKYNSKWQDDFIEINYEINPYSKLPSNFLKLKVANPFIDKLIRNLLFKIENRTNGLHALSRMSKEFFNEYIRGFFLQNMTLLDRFEKRTKRRVRYFKTSFPNKMRSIIETIQLILIRIGYLARIYPGGNDKSFIFELSEYDSIHLLDFFKEDFSLLGIEDAETILNSSNGSIKYKYYDNYLLIKINKLGTMRYSGFVFNIETENHTFCADYFLTHNCDVSEGISDRSTIEVFNTVEMEQCAEYVGKMTTMRFANVIKKVARYYNDAYVIIEGNNMGSGVFNKVYMDDKDPYNNVYKIYTNRKDDMGHKIIKSWMTTSKTRPLLMDEGFNWIAIKEFWEKLKIYSVRLADEMKTLVWNGNRIEHGKGCHDDLWFAFCLALYHRKKAFREYNSMFLTPTGELIGLTEEEIKKAKQTKDNFDNSKVKGNEPVFVGTEENKESYIEKAEKDMGISWDLYQSLFKK